INIKKHNENDNDEHKTDDELKSSTTKIMRALIDKLKIFRFNNTDDLDENALDNGEKLSQKFINKNIKKVENLYFQINNDVEKFYPDLISFNIPRLLKSFPNLKRREVYEIFVQYKTLIKICIALNRSMKIL